MRRRQRRVVVRFSGNGPLTFLRLLDVAAGAANVARTRFAGLRISEVLEKNRKPPSATRFSNKTAGCGRLKSGPGSQISVLHRTSASACRKYAANSGNPEHTAFFK